MAKGSWDAVTRALAMEYAEDGIRINTIALGNIKTPMHEPETYGFSKGCIHSAGWGKLKKSSIPFRS